MSATPSLTALGTLTSGRGILRVLEQPRADLGGGDHGATWWVTACVLGAALLLTVALRRLRTARLVLLSLAATVVVGPLLNAGYALLDGGITMAATGLS